MRQTAAHADVAPDVATDMSVRAIREAIGVIPLEFAAAYEDFCEQSNGDPERLQKVLAT